MAEIFHEVNGRIGVLIIHDVYKYSGSDNSADMSDILLCHQYLELPTKSWADKMKSLKLYLYRRFCIGIYTINYSPLASDKKMNFDPTWT